MSIKKHKIKAEQTPLPEHLGIYVRVSTAIQVEFGISIEDQMKRGRAVALDMNWSFEIFEDAGLNMAHAPNNQCQPLHLA